MEIVCVGSSNAHTRECSRREIGSIRDPHGAVDLRRIRRRPRDRHAVVYRIDEHVLRPADLVAQPRSADRRLRFHEALTALFLHALGDWIGQRVGGCPFNRRVGEAAHAVELRLVQEHQQLVELGVRFTGKPHDERAAQRDVGPLGAPRAHAVQHLLRSGGPFHQPEDARARVLERHVEIGHEAAVRGRRRHQWHDVVDVRVRVNIMEPRPRAVFLRERRKLGRELERARFHRPTPPEAGAVAHVDAVGTRILRHHEQFAHAGTQQALRFGEHVAERAGDEVAAHRRNDAERAAVIAAFGDLEIRVVLGRQLDPLRRNEIQKRIVLGRQRLVHRAHHARVILRAADRKHVRMSLADQIGALTEAAGHDDLAVFLQRLADRVQRFGDGRIDEAAGIDDDDVRRIIRRHDIVAFDPKLGENAFGIYESFRTAEADEADLGVA